MEGSYNIFTGKNGTIYKHTWFNDGNSTKRHERLLPLKMDHSQMIDHVFAEVTVFSKLSDRSSV